MGNEAPNPIDSKAPKEPVSGDTPASAQSHARGDWKCLECDYSLAHTSVDRCPECGTPFSPEAMVVIHADKPTPSYPWDIDNDESSWSATMRMMLFDPAALRRRMSLSPNGEAAAAFSYFNHVLMPALIGIYLFVIVASAGSRGGGAGGEVCFGGLFVAGWSVATFVHELAVISLLAATLKPQRRRSAWAVWAVVVHYASAYPMAVVLINGAGGLLILGVLGINVWTSQAFQLDCRLLFAPIVIGGMSLASISLSLMWVLNIASNVASLSRPTGSRPAVLTLFALMMVAGLLLLALCFVPLTFVICLALMNDSH
jgi:hypothetical protein